MVTKAQKWVLSSVYLFGFFAWIKFCVFLFVSILLFEQIDCNHGWSQCCETVSNELVLIVELNLDWKATFVWLVIMVELKKKLFLWELKCFSGMMHEPYIYYKDLIFGSKDKKFAAQLEPQDSWIKSIDVYIRKWKPSRRLYIFYEFSNLFYILKDMIIFGLSQTFWFSVKINL